MIVIIDYYYYRWTKYQNILTKNYPPVSLMEFHIFEEHARNIIGIDIIGPVISGTIVDKKSIIVT